MDAFKTANPQYPPIFAEMLPPRILTRQIAVGSITIGNIRISLKPDVYPTGKSRIDQVTAHFSGMVVYANKN